MLEEVVDVSITVLRQEENHKFEASLCYIMNSGTTLDTQWDSASNKKEQNKITHGSSQYDRLLPSMTVHTFNVSVQEAEAGVAQWVWGYSGLHGKF